MRPVLVINPSTDNGFVALVREFVAGGAGSPNELERRLRRDYPSAVVRVRGLSDEPVVVWYVYREGRWTPSDMPSDGSNWTA